MRIRKLILQARILITANPGKFQYFQWLLKEVHFMCQSFDHNKSRSISIHTLPVNMSYIRAPRLHQSTALPWPLRVRISGALQNTKTNLLENDLNQRAQVLNPVTVCHTIMTMQCGSVITWNSFSVRELQVFNVSLILVILFQTYQK